MRNEKNMSYCTSTSAITSLSHTYQNIGDHRLGRTKKVITFLSTSLFSRIVNFRLIHKLLDAIMRCISKTFHTYSWCFVFVISNFAWLICIKNVKLTSKRSKFNWKFNSNVSMSIHGVPVSKSAGKFPKFTVHLTHYRPVLLFYTPWKHQKTWRFSVFKGYRKAKLGCNGLKVLLWIQTRTCCFSGFSGGLCESAIFNFFLTFAL